MVAAWVTAWVAVAVAAWMAIPVIAGVTAWVAVAVSAWVAAWVAVAVTEPEGSCEDCCSIHLNFPAIAKILSGNRVNVHAASIPIESI